MKLSALTLCILLFGTGFAGITLKLNSAPVQEAGIGTNPAHFEFKVTADSTETVRVKVATSAGWYMENSDKEFVIGPGGVKYVDLFATIPESGSSDRYPIHLTFETSDKNYYYSGLYVEREGTGTSSTTQGSAQLELKSEYREISVKQGETQTLYFLIRNPGKEDLKNVLISGDISPRLDPEYPVSGFTVYAGETKTLPVKIRVPKDYPEGYYTLTLKAASGEKEASASVLLNVREKYSYAGSLSMTVVALEQYKEEDQVKGYQLVLRVKNNEITDISNVEVHVDGVPMDWEIEGDKLFGIKGSELKEITLRIKTDDFSRQKARISLVKDGEEIAFKELTLGGEEVGITGAFYVGGSLLVGLMVVGLVIAAFLYVRQKNQAAEEEEEEKTKNYLKQLVEQAKTDASTDEQIEHEL